MSGQLTQLAELLAQAQLVARQEAIETTDEKEAVVFRLIADTLVGCASSTMVIGAQRRADEGGAVSVWCDPCNSYHLKPMTKEAHAALKCRLPWKEPKR